MFSSRILLGALLFGAALALPLPTQAEPSKPQALKLLTIGNSFSHDASFYLADMARAAGKEVVLFGANVGGCSLERHARHLKAYEADPENPNGKPYKINGISYSLPEALKSDHWDYVTIQQVSYESFDAETYEPHAGVLIAAIKQHAPDAEIVVHQTWAYREDAWDFKKDGFGQKEMFEQLEAAYARLAKTYGLRILPVGAAFQAARATSLWRFRFPDPDFDYKNPKPGDIPKQPGSLNIGWQWKKGQKNGKSEFELDAKHANAAGRFLGACVWYECLFGENVTENTYAPKDLDPDEAESLRKIAHQTVAEQRKASR